MGPSLKTGMPILVDNPHELGADRLVNAVAAHAKVDGACVAVDFGTSTNFDVVSGAGEYLGGVIGPGVEISMEALTSRTAKLPRIDLSTPEGAIGKHTTAAIQAGFAYGFAGLVDGINRRLAEALGEDATFIATGGLATTIAPHCETIDEVDPPADPHGPASHLRAQRLLASSSMQPPLTSPFRIGDVEIANRVLLAPLAGIGNWFVRLQARRHGAGLAVSEMVSSFGLHYRNERTLRSCCASIRRSTRSPSSSSARTPT